MSKLANFLSGICICLMVTLAGAALTPTLAQSLDVPVMEHASDDLDTCALGQIVGLKADGDGFLAVRSGPATSYPKLDELHNGDQVWLFDQKGEWIGIVYGVGELSCSPISEDRPAPQHGKKGWVHENWVQVIAG